MRSGARMNGELSEHPLAELIREIAAASLTGALRLERERVKVVVYFEHGEIVYASANLRALRLGEVLQRSGVLTKEQLSRLGKKSDGDLATALINGGHLQRSALEKVRAQQVSDVLRTALLWTHGQWSYDTRVRLAEELQTKLDSRLLLMECARHLPRNFVVARFPGLNEVFSPSVDAHNGIGLLPSEAFLLSRVDGPLSLNEMTALSGLRDAEALRVAYTLALGGLLQRDGWSSALSLTDSQKECVSSDKGKSDPQSAPAPAEKPDTADEIKAREERELAAMLARVNRAENHYEILDVGRRASVADIKRAYHKLARRFHPDKFHKSASRKLHGQLESAFARFAQAYETLGDLSLRSAYDAKLAAGETVARGPQTSAEGTGNLRGDPAKAGRGPGASPVSPERTRAEMRFQEGLAARTQEKAIFAVRCFAEAAQLAPDEARYRAHYGSALATQPQARRLAEIELKAAIALDPGNASYHVMLASLYRELGFIRRAQTEVERALILEPANEPARQLLRMLDQID